GGGGGGVGAGKDRGGGGAGGRRGFGKGRLKEAVFAGAVAGGADVRVVFVDALCRRMAVSKGIVDGGKTPAAIEEGVGTCGVVVSPDDLAHIVDAGGLGTPGGQGIVEGGVSAAA